MPKVFHATLIDVELIGPKVRPIGVADGQQVKIPVLDCFEKFSISRKTTSEPSRVDGMGKVLPGISWSK